ncbi:SIR2 family protein [Microbacterium sp. B24]|uniref:SIR2 family protein n=1 Tax=Microbacterium sp. B24 TaxID=95616 RepID=UPI0003F7A9AD|nr:SIR2 family protein [Microbacterium sp. B24]
MDQRLANAANSGNIVLVAGTGVSAAISGTSTATWRGLLESGVERLDGFSSPALVDNLRRNLAFGFDDDDLATVLQAADRIRQEFDGVGVAGFMKWLSEDIGQLPVAHASVGDALRSLPFPILTTNYDTLLATDDRRAATWQDTADMQEIMSGASRDIGHLHGVWTAPESVILSAADYDRLLAAEAAQMLQRSVSFLKSMVYVGYGAGLSDPNFSRLIELHSRTFGVSGVNHFRLCRESELENLRQRHAGDHIIPVSYGERHEDLASFLLSLGGLSLAAPVSAAGIVRDLAGAACMELADSMVADSILAEPLEQADQLSVADVVLPPILLPVPHAEYIRSRRDRTETRIERSDPFNDAHTSDVVLLVGDEGSGLSTAANWVAYQAATHLGGAAPISVSFRQVGAGPSPLTRLVRNNARAHGWVTGENDELPSHVLTVHDFSPYVTKVSDRAISDIASSGAVVRILTCALGSEDDVVERLKAVGLAPTLRYLGRLSSRDVEAYAKVAAPLRYKAVAERVVNVLTNESLSRTPLTVGLLISVVVRGTSLTANASQTTVLDDYMGALLGRGDPHEDARLGMDQSSREALLSLFARHFVLENTGGVSESDATRVFEESLARLSWKESAAEILQSLVDRRILRRTDGRIVFARSSFLHLFAAKRAVQDADFLEHLLSDPLYYSAILADYSALNRHDVDLLSRLDALLADDEWSTEVGGVYAEIQQRPQPDVAAAAEDRLADPARRRLRERSLDLLEITEDVDETPFPTTQHEELPLGLRLMRILELVSVVLRDSDQIEDGEKKREVLQNVLQHWGLLMSTLEKDPEFVGFVRDVASSVMQLRLESQKGDPAEVQIGIEDSIAEIARIFPAALAYGGVNESLASRRLLVPLARVVKAAKSEARLDLTVASAFMLVAVKEPGWIDQLRDLLEKRGNIWVIRNFLLTLMIADYVRDRVRQADRLSLRDLILDIIGRSFSYHSAAEKTAHRGKLAQQLEADRSRWAADGGADFEE